MDQYAVAFRNFGAYDFGSYWIEFYWADDADHAREQAADANCSAAIMAVALVPEDVPPAVLFEKLSFKEGWGVSVTVIGDEDQITDISVSVVEITALNAVVVGNILCVKNEDNHAIPIENFDADVPETPNDTHDLRSRWFATQEEAETYARFTANRWRNPQPWESFVRL